MTVKKICNKTGCNQLIDAKEKYCEKHQHQGTIEKRERHRYYDQHKRDRETAAFYHSKQWIAVREQALIRDNYLCQDCLEERKLTKADVVDHILPIKLFWHLRLVLSNLRSLCHSHHNQKTQEDKKKYTNLLN
jgi:5-methylcytosine-specific restriction protein A